MESLVCGNHQEFEKQKIKSSVKHLAVKIDKLAEPDLKLVENIVDRLQENQIEEITL